MTKKILIIKVGAIGDVLRSSFIAQGLYNKYKDSEITWLTHDNVKLFFVNNPYVTRIISNSEINRENLAKEEFDIVINLEEDEIYTKFASSFDAEKIGFLFENNKAVPSETAVEWFNMSLVGEKPMNDFLKLNSKKTHRQLIAEIFGFDYKKYEPYLKLGQEQINKSDEFYEKYNLKKDEIIIGLNVGGAGRWLKQLPPDVSAKLIDSINEKIKCKVILFRGPDEKERNQKIMSLVNTPVIEIATEKSISDFLSLVNICTHVVSTDTFGLHAALALKKKVVCLIGPTPSNELDMYGIGEKVIAKDECVCCLKPDCKSMENIDVSEVVEKLANSN